MPEVRKLWQTEGLFSDHYLKSRLNKNEWWPTDAQTQAIWQFCKNLYEKRYLACAKNNEAFTRQELLDKILEQLNFPWTDNLGLPESQQDLEPDYVLYASPEEKERVIDKSAAERYRASIAILEAKKLNHPLSQISKHLGRYPHQQIRDYLNEAQVLSWGILTNGNEWRLYCRDSKPSHFFALNFEVSLKSLEDFKFFVALFSPAAFARDAQGRCRLDQIRESALGAQSELEEDLRHRIFTILEILANGFAERPENHIGDTDEDRRKLYENCLIFLYRLLFILYAEGRQLLPVEPRSRKYYKELSLARLIRPLKNFSEFDSHSRTRLYEDIRELCHLINGTDEKKNTEYKVPRYNGGLFDPGRYPDLEQWRVCDAVLADVLRGLMFNPLPDPLQPALPVDTVDFGDLRVQQLGSIYEGLLEHHFVRENNRLTLKTAKAERKATGTFYTPDYIVKYIVEQTVTPLLTEIENREPVKSPRAAGKQDNSFANEVLKLNICDPAMGSGHFLVEATTFLADQIVYHPTTKFQAEFVRGESQEQAEIAYWRRRVVEACIYGVDLNPLTVELAKLSLWLTTIATEQPLNFLDHHLRCGNSLIGARLDDIGDLPETRRKSLLKEPAQVRLVFGPNLNKAVSDAIQTIQKIEAGPSDNVGAVKEKEFNWQHSVLPALSPYKAIADLWTATWFGFDLDQENYTASANRILKVGHDEDFTRVVEREDSPGDKLTEWRDIAASRRFLHWELEFPDVFFNDDGTPRERPGFDAVIGNPPYGRLLDAQETELAERALESAAGVGDVFGMFIEQGAALTRGGGLDGWIVPSGWLTAREYGRLRSVVLSRLSPHRIIHLPYDVFGAAYIDCIIFISRKSSPAADGVCLVKRFGIREQVKQIPCSEAAYSPVCFAAWLQDSDKLMVTESGAGQWLRTWQRRPDFTSLGKILRVSRGITPYVEPSVGDRRKTASGFFGSVGRYALEVEKFATVVYDRSLMEYKPPEFFTGKRLIIRRIISRQRRIHATVVAEDFVINKSYLLALRRNESCSLGFALAILNSRLMSKAFVSMSEIAKRDDFPQLDIATVCELPIRRIEFATEEKKRAALANETKQLYERSLEEGNLEGLLAFVAEQLAAKPERADVVHDLLAFLAERMTALNRDKSAAAKQFLTDLKDFHGIDAHALTPKTKLDQFWKLEAAELFGHLKKNVKALAGQNVRLNDTDEEKIRGRFQKSKEKLLPLETQIAFIDLLIDQVVYRLYDLTPEEIKLVEGAGR